MENQATLEVFLFIHNSFAPFYLNFIVEYTIKQFVITSLYNNQLSFQHIKLGQNLYI